MSKMLTSCYVDTVEAIGRGQALAAQAMQALDAREPIRAHDLLGQACVQDPAWDPLHELLQAEHQAAITAHEAKLVRAERAGFFEVLQ